MTFDPQSHGSIFFGKFRDWSYEQESRVIMPLDECRSVESADRRLFLFDIPARHIRRVIIGWRMSPPEIERVKSIVAEHHPAVEVRATRIENGLVHLVD